MKHKSFRAIQLEAKSLRDELSLGLMDAVDIFKVLTIREKVSLLFIPLDAAFSGCYIRKGPVKVIAINASHNLARRRFSAAHELYHMRYHKNTMQRLCLTSNDEKDPLEIEADYFASYFLMLKESLLQFIKSVLNKEKDAQLDQSDLVQIEQYFGISHSTLLWRLLNEGIINEQLKEQLTGNIRSQARFMGYSTALYDQPANPTIRIEGEYIPLVQKAFSEGKISQGKYESYLLDIDREDLVYNLNDGEYESDGEADIC